jgi:hypothetical protein
LQVAVVAEHYNRLSKFIRVQSSPKIFYLPAKHNAVTERLLSETQVALRADLDAARTALLRTADPHTQADREQDDGGEAEEGGEEIQDREKAQDGAAREEPQDSASADAQLQGATAVAPASDKDGEGERPQAQGADSLQEKGSDEKQNAAQ